MKAEKRIREIRRAQTFPGEVEIITKGKMVCFKNANESV